MAALTWFQTQVSRQTVQFFPWCVVFFGAGIWLYFAARFEPSPLAVWIGLLGAVVWAATYYRHRYLLGLAGILPAVVMAGYASAALHAQGHAAPVLRFHYYGPIYGQVIHIDRSSSHAVRLTLDHVQLSGITEEKLPERVRVSLHGDQDWFEAMPGQYVGITGHLSAPSGPVEPGGFDFQRHAWFLKLGAVGYTRVPVLEIKPPGRARAVSQLRRKISLHVSAYLGGDVGGFAAAVTTGDRSAFSQGAIDALRISNLAHLLAISGLHMGLLAAFLFGVLRAALSLYQPLALRLPVKSLAAMLALFGATGYLLLSGASIATQRAYIMAAVALIAVSLDRRALTLRAVAMAGLMVLVLRPSSLLTPGFQMSFAATTALVSAFSAMRSLPVMPLKRWQKSILSLFLSSFVAGLATAPFAATHFNQWAAYGLIANVTAVPVMGMIVIPGAVLAAVLSPFGADWIGLEVMGVGLRWILMVAHWVSGLDGARVPIMSPQPVVLPLICIGGLFSVLWIGTLRWIGAFAFCLAGWFWAQSERPDILISDNGKLVGVLAQTGRALTKSKGQGFVANSWLENDGDSFDQASAASRVKNRFPGMVVAQFGPHRVVHFQGKRGADAFSGCHDGNIVVSDQIIDADLNCYVFDSERLGAAGATAIWIVKDGELKIETVAQKRGQRLWSPPIQKNQ